MVVAISVVVRDAAREDDVVVTVLDKDVITNAAEELFVVTVPLSVVIDELKDDDAL